MQTAKHKKIPSPTWSFFKLSAHFVNVLAAGVRLDSGQVQYGRLGTVLRQVLVGGAASGRVQLQRIPGGERRRRRRLLGQHGRPVPVRQVTVEISQLVAARLGIDE